MLKITVNNQLNQEAFYSEIDMNSIKSGLFGIGYIWITASRNADMSNPFEVMISPENCSVITYEETSQGTYSTLISFRKTIESVQSEAKKHLKKQSDYGGYHGGVNNTCQDALAWITQLEKEASQ